MTLFDRLLSPAHDPREAVRPLWQRVVAFARDPAWYRTCGVADTLEGRFDMVTMVLACVLLRMERSAALAPQTAPLTELFVADMDGQLRQSGVGDLMVGKQIGRLMATLGGRMGALRTALPGDDDALEAVVRRNVTLVENADIAALVADLRALVVRLEATGDEALRAGEMA